MKTILPIFLMLGLAAIPALAQSPKPDTSGIKTSNLKDADVNLMHNHDPKSQLENFELLDGYQVNLFAADPMLANPVHMHWDSRGRLWVACSRETLPITVVKATSSALG